MIRLPLVLARALIVGEKAQAEAALAEVSALRVVNPVRMVYALVPLPFAESP